MTLRSLNCQLSRHVLQRSLQALSCLWKNNQSTQSSSLTEFEQFDKTLEDHLKNLGTTLLPTHSQSLAYYVNISKSLQSLITFGVDLHKIQKNFPECLDMLTKLRIDLEMRPKLVFLNNQGIKPNEFGQVITNNPHVLDPECKIEAMQEILDYLDSKNFSKDQINSMVVRFPKLLATSPLRLDKNLGFLQRFQLSTKKLSLKGEEVRSIAVRRPSLLTTEPTSMFIHGQILERSCKFSADQIKLLLVELPSLLNHKDTRQLELNYLFMIRELKLTNEEVVRFHQLFNTRLTKMEYRHQYLKLLGRAQYKSDKPGYVSPVEMFCCSDENFVEKLGLGPIYDYECFLRTL